MLRIDGLSAWYGEARALRDVSLEVAEGELVTLVGRNGAGKTTLLRCVMGLHGPAEGTVEVLGGGASGGGAHGCAGRSEPAPPPGRPRPATTCSPRAASPSRWTTPRSRPANTNSSTTWESEGDRMRLFGRMTALATGAALLAAGCNGGP